MSCDHVNKSDCFESLRLECVNGHSFSLSLSLIPMLSIWFEIHSVSLIKKYLNHCVECDLWTHVRILSLFEKYCCVTRRIPVGLHWIEKYEYENRTAKKIDLRWIFASVHLIFFFSFHAYTTKRVNLSPSNEDKHQKDTRKKYTKNIQKNIQEQEKALTIAVIILESLCIAVFSLSIVTDELCHTELFRSILCCSIAWSGKHFFHFSVQLYLVRSSIAVSLIEKKNHLFVWLDDDDTNKKKDEWKEIHIWIGCVRVWSQQNQMLWLR